MPNKCMICDKELEFINVFLCKEHLIEILIKTNSNTQKIEKATFNEHCQICGNWENRSIWYLDGWFSICNVCLDEARTVYNL